MSTTFTTLSGETVTEFSHMEAVFMETTTLVDGVPAVFHSECDCGDRLYLSPDLSDAEHEVLALLAEELHRDVCDA